MGRFLLDIPIEPEIDLPDLLEYAVIGLLIAGAIAAAVLLIVYFTKKKKKK